MERREGQRQVDNNNILGIKKLSPESGIYTGEGRVLLKLWCLGQSVHMSSRNFFS
jgi:hypothetical protein